MSCKGGTELNVTAAFHAGSGEQVVAFPTDGQPFSVKGLVCFLMGREVGQMLLNAIEDLLPCAFTQKATFTLLHSYLITNLTTEQGGRVAVKPSAVTLKPSKGTGATAVLFSKVL